jgi:glycosyltransferase involved in cell wall biosynthesis
VAEYKPLGHKLVENPKVSVCITTYNHEKYIAEALESALMQETDFPVEIIVGEDDSSDGTREICKRYKERFPERIRLFLNSREDVIYIEGLATGRANMINLLAKARGECIAMLEGDDYWTESQKLALQVDVLDSRSDLSFCFHRAWVLDEESGNKRPFHDQFFAPPSKSEGSAEDLFFQWFVPSASLFFRRSMLPDFPDWYLNSISGDHGLQLLLATRGNFVMIDRYMSIYRRHEGGLSNRLGKVHGGNWMRMHHSFNVMHSHRFDRLLAKRLNGGLRQAAFASERRKGDLAERCADLRASIQYGLKCGELSVVRSLGRTMKWIWFQLLTRLNGVNRRYR